LAGLMQAALNKFDESAKLLTSAGMLAPSERRPKLVAAAETARREGEHNRLLQQGDAAMAKADYPTAAKLYADCWETSPGNVQIGMQSAIAFLMADQVPLGVQILKRLRQAGTPEISEKAGLMLTELGPISPDAKTAAGLPRSAETEEIADAAKLIPTQVGDLRSADMILASTPNPPLLGDDLKFAHVNDDEINTPASDVILISTESLFTIYRRRVSALQSLAAPQSYVQPEPGPPAGPAQTALPSGPPALTLPARPGRLGNPINSDEPKLDNRRPESTKPEAPKTSPSAPGAVK
jgi:hypothetical protein